VRLVLFVLFWVGLFATVREWRYARKHDVAITLAEKLLLALALPLGLVAQLAVELAGFTPDSGTIALLVICVVLTGWAMKRRIQRTA
jgi:hypothetical protein